MSSHDRTLSYADALCEATAQEMRRDRDVLVMGLDVDDHKAIQGSTRGLVQEFGPRRVFTTPLSEDAMTGVAIGAAMTGLRPIHVHIRMDFLLLCMNQIINMAAKARTMFGGGVKVPLVVRSIIGKSWGQGAQHSQGLHALFMHVPGLKVVAPSTPYDAKGCLIAAIRDDNPVIFVEHRLLYASQGPVPEHSYEVPFGQARVTRRGHDITILGISNMAMESLLAADLLAAHGIEAEVIDPISLAPLDMATIIASVRRTRRLLVVDAAWTTCGASAEIVAATSEALGSSLVASRRMGFATAACPTTPWLESCFYSGSTEIFTAAYHLVFPDKTIPEPPKNAPNNNRNDAFRGPF